MSLPQEVEYCERCIISNQRPRVVFDENGVCTGCINRDYKETVDWAEREVELKALCDKHRRHDGYWDVVIPSSGGKDSFFVAHQLNTK